MLDDLPWKDERGPSSIRRTAKLFQRKHWENLWVTGWRADGLFQAHRYYRELNWTVMGINLGLWCTKCVAETDLKPYMKINNWCRPQVTHESEWLGRISTRTWAWLGVISSCTQHEWFRQILTCKWKLAAGIDFEWPTKASVWGGSCVAHTSEWIRNKWCG